MKLTYSPSEPEYLTIELNAIYLYRLPHTRESFVYYQPYYYAWNGSQRLYWCNYGYSFDSIDFGVRTQSESDMRAMTLYVPVPPTRWQRILKTIKSIFS